MLSCYNFLCSGLTLGLMEQDCSLCFLSYKMTLWLISTYRNRFHLPWSYSTLTTHPALTSVALPRLQMSTNTPPSCSVRSPDSHANLGSELRFLQLFLCVKLIHLMSTLMMSRQENQSLQVVHVLETSCYNWRDLVWCCVFVTEWNGTLLQVNEGCLWLLEKLHAEILLLRIQFWVQETSKEHNYWLG